jgi:hypothetical protein
MRSRFGQCVIAFLLTSALVWCFREAVLQRSFQRDQDEILAQEEYQRFQRYVGENNLDYQKIRTICLAVDEAKHTPVSDYLINAVICALTIIPYSILLALIRRLAGRFPDSSAMSNRHQTSKEYLE